jgi:hypothetical protein
MVSSFFGGQGLFECLKCPCVVDLYSFFFPTAYPETGVWMLLNSEAFYMRITFVKASLGRLAELISTSFTSASLFTCILRVILLSSCRRSHSSVNFFWRRKYCVQNFWAGLHRLSFLSNTFLFQISLCFAICYYFPISNVIFIFCSYPPILCQPYSLL